MCTSEVNGYNRCLLKKKGDLPFPYFSESRACFESQPKAAAGGFRGEQMEY